MYKMLGISVRKKCTRLAGIVPLGLLSLILTVHWTTSKVPATVIVAPKSNSTQRLQNSVHRMNAWLYDSEHAEGWRRVLKLNVLETQAARGEQANVTTLNEIYQCFDPGVPGLNHPAFADVRTALAQQIQHLSSSRIGDLYAAVTMARGQFRRISPSDMAYQRDLAKSALVVLEHYYRNKLSSRERANFFHDLQLDQAVQFLDQINFVLAPEISVGKMDSMIRRVQQQKDEIEKVIDAMPAIEGPDDTDGGEQPGDNTTDPVIEPALDNLPNILGPQPDEDERTLEELQQEIQVLDQQIENLKTQRRQIAQQDKPRQTERRNVFGKLREIEQRLVDLSESRHDPYFASAIASFERFNRTYFYGTSDNLQEDFLKRLESLETNLLEMDGLNGREAAGKLGDDLRWMENANQIPQLITAIRSRYSNPNVYISVSAKLINEVGSQTVSESRCLRQTVDGRLVRGVACTQGQVSIELQNDPNQVHANIRLLGSVSSQTYVEQGRIRVFADSNGQLEGRRSIYANVGGLFAGEPYVAANLQASLKGTNSRLRLVNRIVARKFAESKASTESSSSRQAEEELMRSFRKQTDEPISNGQEAIAKAQDRRVLKSSLIPEIYLRSFPSEVMAVGKKSSISTLGAPDQPAQTGVLTDLAVRLHESMLSNFLDRTFSGKTFSDQELADKMGELFGQKPDSLTAKPGEGKDESFSITFANVRPVQFEFQDNAFRVVVSGRRFSQGDKKINEGLKIILSFRIKRINGKLMFVRDGNAQLEFLDDDYPASAVAFKSFLDAKLNPKEGAEQISVELPDDLLPIEEIDALKDSDIAKRLRLVQCRSENGWLYLGWNCQPAHGSWSWQYDLPAVLNENTIFHKEPTYLYEAPSGTFYDAPPGIIEETIPGAIYTAPPGTIHQAPLIYQAPPSYEVAPDYETIQGTLQLNGYAY